ncbi:hypothetical protein F-VV10_0054 [Faustovirus]|nr:hypothetical protein F-VV10_0054 [Faustovirus]
MAETSIPPEITEIIASYNPIAFARTCRWLNQTYRTGIASDYLTCIRPVFRCCATCDMIYSIFDMQFNTHYHKLPISKQVLVNLARDNFTAENARVDRCYIQLSKISECIHAVKLVIYTFRPHDMINILRRRAYNNDRGLLLYLHSIIPADYWDLIKSIYDDIKRELMQPNTGKPLLRTDFSYRLISMNESYWQQIVR